METLQASPLLQSKESSIQVLGPKLWIKLQPISMETTTPSGLTVYKYKNYETDGGRIQSAIASDKFGTQGTIYQISATAQKLLDEELSPLKVGDEVLIDPSAKYDRNWFFPDRSKSVQDWEGDILLHPNMVQAKINEPSK